MVKKIIVIAILGGIFLIGGATQTIKRSQQTPVSGDIFKMAKNYGPYCNSQTTLSHLEDVAFCQHRPIFQTERTLEINLTKMRGLYYEKGKLQKTFEVKSRAPQGVWYQTPTGFYGVGVKRQSHQSSLAPVLLPYSIQYYEDFFIHAVPVDLKTGQKVPPGYSGGCIRLADGDAAYVFNKIQSGDRIVVYETLPKIKKGSEPTSPRFDRGEFIWPVEPERVWVRQAYNSPFRMFWQTADKRSEYYHHTGLDLAGWRFEVLPVRAIGDGKVVAIERNKPNGDDHGLGLTVITEHQLPEMVLRSWGVTTTKAIYALYAHLQSVESNIKIGESVKRGQILGQIGHSAFGCQQYWRIGQDGCEQTSQPDRHLHFEIKTKPVLGNSEGDKPCYNKVRAENWPCYGYTPEKPKDYGYLDPIKVIAH